MFNNNFNNNQMGTMYGQQKLPNMSQPIDKEKYDIIRQKSPQFSLAVNEEDLYRSICTHKSIDGSNNITLVENTNPNLRGDTMCTVCGETFNYIDFSEAEVQEAVDTVIDILQTIKTRYLDLPVATIQEYFPIIALLKKIPKLYTMSNRDFSKYGNNNVNPMNNNGLLNNYNMLRSGMQFAPNPIMGGMNPGMMNGGFNNMNQNMNNGFGMPQQNMYGGNPLTDPYNNGGYGMPQQNNNNMMGGFNPQQGYNMNNMNMQNITQGGQQPAQMQTNYVPGAVQNPNNQQSEVSTTPKKEVAMTKPMQP